MPRSRPIAVSPADESVRVTVACDRWLWRRWDVDAGAWQLLPDEGRLVVARGLGDVRASIDL